MSTTYKDTWEAYCASELARIKPLLSELGFTLDEAQPHLGGERYLMQAVTTVSGKKLILIGCRTVDQKRVVIKVTNDQDGIQELTHERVCRKVIHEIKFAYHIFLSPEEIYFGKKGGYLFSIQEFIEQEQAFLERPIEQQFMFALNAFKAQEGAHATTYEHAELVRKTFGQIDAAGYVSSFAGFTHQIQQLQNNAALADTLRNAFDVLNSDTKTLQQYCGFLTHTDFVPHNFRIRDEEMYLLDYASIRFGNKYEGWARFQNFMVLYNPELERALESYVEKNRPPEELRALHHMEVYRLGEIILYYVNAVQRSEGDLFQLNTARVAFWTDVLRARLNHETVSPTVIAEYKSLRDRLRSESERSRQQQLH